jgi:hypothetical protein
MEMESLDDYFESLHVDLEADEKEEGRLKTAEETQEARRRSETFTDSILRDDVVAPHIVHFTSTYGVKSRNRKLAVIFLVLVLSVSSLYRFSKLIVPFFQEASSVIVDKDVENSDSIPSGDN